MLWPNRKRRKIITMKKNAKNKFGSYAMELSSLRIK
jgi:hypothetical protein